MTIPAPLQARLAMQIQTVIDQLAAWEAGVLRGLVTFFLTLVIVYGVTRFGIVRYTTRAMTARKVDPSIVSLARLVGQIGSMFLAFAMAFAVAGFGSFLTALSAVSGAIVIAVGLAADALIANLLAGLYIINEKLFEVGDWIEWEDKRGRVERIDLRVTRIRTFDNELVAVPNSTLANTAITNPVAFGRLRISVQFDVGYADVDRATDIILAEARRFPQVLDAPEPSVRIAELGDTFVGLNARVWMGNPSRSDFNRLRTAYIRGVLRRLENEGIAPDPHPVRLSGGVDVGGWVDGDAGVTSSD